MQPTRKSKASQSAETISAWLISRLAELLTIEPTEIDVRGVLASYGLSSIEAVELAVELEEWLGRELSPTLVYDYPSIESLAWYLAEGPDISGDEPSN